MNLWTAQQTRHLPVFSAALAMGRESAIACGKPVSGNPETRRWRP